MRVIRGPSESELHLTVAQTLDWLLLPPAFYSTFPSGWGVLSPSMAQRLKKSGLKAGMPDIMLFYDGRSIGIELKAGKNALSPAQVATIDKLRCAGIPVYVCLSVDEVLDVLLHERMPLRDATIGSDLWRPRVRNAPRGATSAKHAGVDADTGGADGAR